MEEALLRREFLCRGLLAALGAGLTSCVQRPLGASPGLTRTHETPPAPANTSTPVPQGLYEARYYRRLEDNWVQCEMCFRRCTVPGVSSPACLLHPSTHWKTPLGSLARKDCNTCTLAIVPGTSATTRFASSAAKSSSAASTFLFCRWTSRRAGAAFADIAYLASGGIHRTGGR
jgi:hypothetical protein